MTPGNRAARFGKVGLRAATQASEQQPRRATIRDIARARRRLEGRRLVRAQRPTRRLRRDARPDPRDRRRARLVPESRGACALGVARGRAAVSCSPVRPTTIALEPFFMEFIAGVETQLSARSIGLTLQLVRSVEEEIEVYRRWFGEHRVDGVFLVDLRRDDPRVDALEELGLPGGRDRRARSRDAAPVGLARRGARRSWRRSSYLAALGHRRIARVAGVAEFMHTDERTQAFGARCASSASTAQVVATDYTREERCAGHASAALVGRAADRDHLRQRPARGHRPRRRPADGLRRPRRPLDRRMGRLADQPGRASAADGDHARHRARTARPPRPTCSGSSTGPRRATSRFRAAS